MNPEIQSTIPEVRYKMLLAMAEAELKVAQPEMYEQLKASGELQGTIVALVWKAWRARVAAKEQGLGIAAQMEAMYSALQEVPICK